MEAAGAQRLMAALAAEGLPEKGIEATPLLGDASAREYYRLTGEALLPRIAPDWTAIGMVMPIEPPPDGELPFLDVLRYLERCGLAMPSVYLYRPEFGVLLMQDLQDATLERWLEGLSPAEQEAAYREAIDMLVDMQVRTCLQPDPRCIGFRRAFDAERYLWEMRRFRRFVLEWGGLYPLSERDLAAVQRCFVLIARRLLDQPLVFTHRDYHSRNIMVHLGRLYMIDFQDARLGVQTYDIASLLRDSYRVLPPALAEELLGYYLNHSAQVRLPSPGNLTSLFYWTAAQRNMHAAACFAVFHLDRGNPRYLRYLGPTLDYLCAHLRPFRELSPLLQVVEARLPMVSSEACHGLPNSPEPR